MNWRNDLDRTELSPYEGCIERTYATTIDLAVQADVRRLLARVDLWTTATAGFEVRFEASKSTNQCCVSDGGPCRDLGVKSVVLEIGVG